MNARADIDLVLPCYNPPSGWEERVATHFREVERLFSPVRFHLFIVSDGSRRGYEPETIDRLRQLIPNVCVVDYKPNRGKGYALREAVKRCTSPYIIYTDYDFPYTNDSFGRMVETLLGGADVVVATRSKSYQENLPPFRQSAIQAVPHMQHMGLADQDQGYARGHEGIQPSGTGDIPDDPYQ